jgi:double-GTPase-like protein
LEPVILVVIVVVVIALGVGTRLRRKADRYAERTADEAGAEQASAPVPTFKVVALGLPGSGKTVLLASMFHELDHIAPGRSFYLDTTPEQRVALNGVYRTVSDPRRDWPRATRLAELTAYAFNCVALDEDGGRHHLLDVVYIDYAGELLEHTPEAGRSSFQELQSHIRSAQALLGLLDGQRILQLLRGERAGHDYLQFEVRSQLGLMQSAQAPVQLVITKWDLVRGFGEPPDADDRLRLDCVISALMAYDHVRGLVYSSPNQLVRLIPVSAVGRGFAELAEDGSVVKRSGGTVRPMNVDVPLCAVVPDLFRQVERSIDDDARRKLEESLRRSLKGRSMRVRAVDVLSGLGTFLNGSAGRALGAVFAGVMPGVVGVAATEVTRMFAEWAAAPYERVADARELHEAEFGRYRAVRERVLVQFETAVRRLEAVMPNSELGRR